MHVDRSIGECGFGHLCLMSAASIGLVAGVLMLLI